MLKTPEQNQDFAIIFGILSGVAAEEMQAVSSDEWIGTCRYHDVLAGYNALPQYVNDIVLSGPRGSSERYDEAHNTPAHICNALGHNTAGSILEENGIFQI